MDDRKTQVQTGGIWEQVRLLYVTGAASCGQAAQQFGLSRGAVERRCAKEGWVEQRRGFRKRLYDRALERAEVRGAEVMQVLCASAGVMAERLRQVLEDPDAFRRYLVSDKAGGPKREEIFERTDMDAFRAAMGTLKQLTETVRDLWGIPGVRQEEALRLARERLEMLRERDGSTGPGKVVVEIEGGGNWCG